MALNGYRGGRGGELSLQQGISYNGCVRVAGGHQLAERTTGEGERALHSPVRGRNGRRASRRTGHGEQEPGACSGLVENGGVAELARQLKGVDDGRRAQRSRAVDAAHGGELEEEGGELLAARSTVECTSDLQAAFQGPRVAKACHRGSVVIMGDRLEPDTRQTLPRSRQSPEALHSSFPARSPRIIETVEQLEFPQPHGDGVRARCERPGTTARARRILHGISSRERDHLRHLAPHQGVHRPVIVLQQVGDPVQQASPLEQDVRCSGTAELLELPGEIHGGSVRQG